MRGSVVRGEGSRCLRTDLKVLLGWCVFSLERSKMEASSISCAGETLCCFSSSPDVSVTIYTQNMGMAET